MPTTINQINCFENFKLQVNALAKYLENLEGIEFLRSCNCLENIFKPYIEKGKEMQCRLNRLKVADSQLKDLTDSGRQLLISTSKFDAEQTLTEKFFSAVPDDSLYLTDNLLMNNNFLEEIKTSTQRKDISSDRNSSTFSQSILEESIKGSPTYYEIALKDHSSHTYLDLSNKSNSKISLSLHHPKNVINEGSAEDEMNTDSNTDIILNLCSKSKAVNLKYDQNLPSESNINEELDNLPYHISTSNLFTGERFLEKNESNTSNPDFSLLSNTKLVPNPKDFNKMLNTNCSGNIRVIHSTNSFKEDKNALLTSSEYHSTISEVEDTLSNEPPKEYLKTNLHEDFAKSDRLENCEGEIQMNCDSDTILNLKKEPECVVKENLLTKDVSSQDSSSSLLNLGLHSILHIFSSPDKNLNTQEKKKTVTENSVRALNLVNKKYKQLFTENLKSNSTVPPTSEQNSLDVVNPLTPGETQQCTSQQTLKDGKISEINLWTDHEMCDVNLFCNHCNTSFKSKVIYNKHMASHKRNTCTQCPSTFSRHQFLRTHMKTEHGIDLVTKTFPCQHCSRFFMKKSSMYYHLQSHAMPHQKVCSKCGKFIEGEDAFKDHMEEHVKNASLQCHICNAIFQRQQQYNDHMEGHKKNKCAYCECISFSSKKSLFKHYKTEHPNLPQKVVLNKRYSCDLCTRVFTRPSLLKDHKLTHTDLKHLECRLCHVKYLQRSSLKKHIKNVHSQTATTDKVKMEHTCQLCGYVCSSLVLLNKHSVNAHNMTVSHACSYCDYKTKYRHLLKRHMDTHLEIKKYLCDICGSLFHSSSTLKHHTVFLHSNERRFKCKKCSKTFKNKSCLSRHSRIHSNERPYKCECGSCYKQMAHLSRHLSTAHNKKLPTRKIIKVGLVEDKDKGQNLHLKREPMVSNGQTFIPPIRTDSLLVSEAEKSPNDILLASGSAVFMTEGSVTPDPAPLFTVLDSQLIHLIPSTLQLHQEGIHAVSLMNGEFHAFSIASPASYQVSQGESFSTSTSSDVVTLHPSSNLAEGPLGLEETPVGRTEREKVDLEVAVDEADEESDENSHLTLEDSHHLHFASTSIQELQYRGNEEDNEAISTLSPSPFLPQQESSLTHDISNNNISIF